MLVARARVLRVPVSTGDFPARAAVVRRRARAWMRVLSKAAASRQDERQYHQRPELLRSSVLREIERPSCRIRMADKREAGNVPDSRTSLRRAR